MESAPDPAALQAKLREWGHPALVIPHGTAWGAYTPADASFEKQLTPAAHDPALQTLIEVYSGHGNSEEYRSFRPVVRGADGLVCPEPTPDHLPSCWRAGELIRARCLEAGESDTECDARAATARAHHVAAGLSGDRTVPGVEAGTARSRASRPRSGSIRANAAIASFPRSTTAQRVRCSS
jgi:hypothetical protein